MQITPSSVTSPVKDTQPNSGKVSRRRLFFLAATATVASSLGIALGGTLRFQVVPVSQAAPLFKPQQDFPPLAEWPPEIPPEAHRDFDASWENDEAPSSQLIYNDRLSTELEGYEASEDDFSSTEYASDEETLVPADMPSPIPADFSREDGTQDVTNMVFEEETLPPLVSTNTGELDHEAVHSPPQLEDTVPLTDTSPWFNKQPASELQFTDGPIIISPEEPIPSSNVLSD